MGKEYKDSSLPAEERAELLLSLMTVEEKIGQLLQPFGWKTYRKEDGGVQLDEAFKADIRDGGVGSLYGALRADPWTGVTLETGLSPEEGARAVNEIQRYAVEESRLGIPILFGEECSHGHMAIGATVYPVPILLGSTWNVELYKRVCRGGRSSSVPQSRSGRSAVRYDRLQRNRRRALHFERIFAEAGA